MDSGFESGIRVALAWTLKFFGTPNRLDWGKDAFALLHHGSAVRSPRSLDPGALRSKTRQRCALWSDRSVACILGIPREHPDVEDCTHEALRRAVEGRSSLRSGDALRPWVVGIARHVALDALRTRQRRRARDGGGDDVMEEVADNAPLPDEAVEKQLEKRRVLQALERLPEGQREALMLFHGEGLGYQQISARMGVPLGTVATWITRGRQAMAAAVEGDGER